MKKLLCIFMIVATTLNVGCFNYRDMNKLLFALATILDVDTSGDIILYGEFFKTHRYGEEKIGREDRVIIKGRGETLLDAFYDINTLTGSPVAYDVNRVLIYTERAARAGMDVLVDSSLRNQRPTLREFMFIYCGNPEDLVDIQIRDENFIGLFLDNSMIYQGKLLNIARLRLDEYSNNRLMGSRVNIMPIIKTSEESKRDRLEFSGAAIISDDKMIGRLEKEEVEAYKFLMNDIKLGAIITKNPMNEGKVISLDILKGSTKKSLKYNGDRIECDFKINVRSSLEEAQKGIILTNDNIRKQVKESAEKTVKDRCENLLRKCKEENIDILNIQRELEVEYHGLNIENIMDKVDFNLDINIDIEGSQVINDSK